MSLPKVYWITGASSGIGFALAFTLAKKGNTLILSSRNIEKLNSIAKKCESHGAKCHVLPLDLSKIDDLESKVKKAKTLVSKIDYLINNGGLSQRSLVIETNLEVDRRIFEVNYFGTITLTRYVLPWMIETGGGNISVVSSIAGKFGFPYRSSYSASKHALIGFFETLGLENANNNINVTVILPGRIQTDISVNALNASGGEHKTMDDGQANGITAEKCAIKIVKAIHSNKHEVLIGGKELLMVYFHKWIPSLFRKIAKKLN